MYLGHFHHKFFAIQFIRDQGRDFAFYHNRLYSFVPLVKNGFLIPVELEGISLFLCLSSKGDLAGLLVNWPIILSQNESANSP